MKRKLKSLLAKISELDVLITHAFPNKEEYISTFQSVEPLHLQEECIGERKESSMGYVYIEFSEAEDVSRSIFIDEHDSFSLCVEFFEDKTFSLKIDFLRTNGTTSSEHEWFVSNLSELCPVFKAEERFKEDWKGLIPFLSDCIREIHQLKFVSE